MSLPRSGINGWRRTQRDDRVRIGSHTASDVRRIASHALHPYPAKHAAPHAIFMLTDQIPAVATVAMAGMHGRSPSVAALRLEDVSPRTGRQSTTATPRNAGHHLEIAHEESGYGTTDLCQYRYHASHPKIPAATEPTSDD